MIIRLLVPVTFAFACSTPAPSSGTGSGSGSSVAQTGSAAIAASTADAAIAMATLDPDPCSADQLGLPGAKKLAHKLLRSGCRPKASATPLLITSEEQFAMYIECADKATGPSHNWSTGMLVVATRSPPPAETGVIAYDDGKVVTFVSMQRMQCSDDARPMPGPPQTHVVIAEPSGTRTVAERACTIKRVCP